MPQFSIRAGSKVGQTVTLSPADSKHLIRVLRAKPREKVRLFDGTSRFEAELVTLSPQGATAKLTTLLVTPAMRGEVTLCQALLKKDKMEWVIQKAVELGASRLIPFSSERTIPKPKEIKLSRWQKIADEALKQCGRVKPMKVEPVMGYQDLLKKLPVETGRILFCSEGDKSPLAPLCQRGEVSLLIGPEGGFSENEIQAAKRAGCLLRSMGPLTLRAETAAVAALTLVQHGLGNI